MIQPCDVAVKLAQSPTCHPWHPSRAPQYPESSSQSLPSAGPQPRKGQYFPLYRSATHLSWCALSREPGVVVCLRQTAPEWQQTTLWALPLQPVGRRSAEHSGHMLNPAASRLGPGKRHEVNKQHSPNSSPFRAPIKHALILSKQKHPGFGAPSSADCLRDATQ